MRRVLSWIAMCVLVFPVSPVGADDTDARITTRPHTGTLEQRLRDMSSEAARFFDGLPESERTSLRGIDAQQTVETRDETELARLRVRMRQLSPGAEIIVVLRDGERVRGELAGATEDEFSLNVPHLTGRKGVKFDRTFHYEEVESADLPEAKGWSAPEKIRELAIGKRIEMLLLDGSKVNGSLKSVTGRRFELEVGKKDVREYSFDEIASVRPAGMRTSSKVVLAVGIPLAILLALSIVASQLG